MDNPTIRYGARGIVVNEEGEIAIFNKHFKNEYKLPGGGIEKEENIEEAFRREIMEETGCTISNIEKMGITIEEKGQTNFCQISYVFQAKVNINTHELHLTEKEKNEGGELIWLSPLDAYDKVSNCINNVIGSLYDDRYKTLFMVKRDALIIKYYLKQKKILEKIYIAYVFFLDLMISNPLKLLITGFEKVSIILILIMTIFIQKLIVY